MHCNIPQSRRTCELCSCGVQDVASSLPVLGFKDSCTPNLSSSGLATGAQACNSPMARCTASLLHRFRTAHKAHSRTSGLASSIWTKRVSAHSLLLRCASQEGNRADTSLPAKKFSAAPGTGLKSAPHRPADGPCFGPRAGHARCWQWLQHNKRTTAKDSKVPTMA